MTGRTVGAVLLVVVMSGCGLGDKQHRADSIIDSVDKVFAAGTATGFMGVSWDVVKVPDVGREAERQDAGGPPRPRQAAPPPAIFGVGLDFENRRALLSRDQKHPEIFDNLDLYGTRLGVSERDVRPWLRLRLADLEEGTGELRVPDDSPISLSSAINPIVLVDLAAGALAGSIKTGVPVTVRGVPMTRYRANFDIEKTFGKTREDNYPEEQREAIESAFSLLTIKGGVNKGTAWVDQRGRLRRFQLQLRVSRQRDLEFGVTFDLRLLRFGRPVDLVVPDDATILEADSMVAFLRAVVPELAAREAA